MRQETHIALPVKRVKQDATKGKLVRRGQPRFSPGFMEKVNVVTHCRCMPYGLIGVRESRGEEGIGGGRLTFGNI